MKSAWFYRPVFYLGVAVLACALLLGFYQSWRTEQRLPGLRFANLEEIERLMQQGRHDEAIARLEMTLELVSLSRHVTHNMLGNALQGQQRYDEAIEHFRRALELQPDFVEAHNNLGIALARSEEWVPAMDAFRQAIRLDPGFELGYQNLARAASAYEGWLTSAPGDAQGRSLLAEVQELLQQRQQTAPPPNSSELLRGRTLVAQFYQARLVEMRSQFSPALAQRMGITRLSDYQQQLVDQLGQETELLREATGAEGTGSYTRWARFARFDGVVELNFVFADGGGVEDFRIRLGDTEE